MKNSIQTLLCLVLFMAHVKAVSWSGEFVPTKEGYSEINSSEKLKNAWDSSVPIIIATSKTSDFYVVKGSGSGVIAFKKVVGDAVYLGILTARHVVNSGTPIVRPIKKIIFDMQSGQRIAFEEFEGARLISSSVSEQVDLGLIIMRVSSKEGMKLNPVSFPQQCALSYGDPIAFIGYPNTFGRALDKQKVPIENPTLLTKRVSTGFYVGDKAKTQRMPGFVYGTTADSMPGNSGGTALNQNGELVGVISSSDRTNDNAYSGSEDSGVLKSHGYIVDCQASKDFAQTRWQNFLKTLPIAL